MAALLAKGETQGHNLKDQDHPKGALKEQVTDGERGISYMKTQWDFIPQIELRKSKKTWSTWKIIP